VRRETQNVLLVLLGGAVLKISLNGQYLRYVKPSLHPWLVVAGVVAVALAAAGIARDIRAASARAHGLTGTAGSAGEPHGGHGHGADDHGTRGPWLLLLPVLAIFLVAPPALGADKVARYGDRTAVGPAPSEGTFRQLPAGDAPLLSIGDAVTRAVWDGSGTLDGRQIRLVGFVVRKPDGAVDLARLVISCCAADAAPVKVRLDGGGAGAYASDTWLEARGEVVPRSATEANGYVPTFTVSELHEVPAPADPYES
jgi:uncharacterized repeat protein (TIGR03943 family)